MSINRPDAYLCNKCGLRFNDEDKKTKKEQVNGIFSLVVVCPNCESSDLKTTISGT